VREPGIRKLDPARRGHRGLRPGGNAACDEPFGREQAFGYKAEDEYEYDDEDDSGNDDNLVILIVLELVLEKRKFVKDVGG
jgi:hypothetical protein